MERQDKVVAVAVAVLAVVVGLILTKMEDIVILWDKTILTDSREQA